MKLDKKEIAQQLADALYDAAADLSEAVSKHGEADAPSVADAFDAVAGLVNAFGYAGKGIFAESTATIAKHAADEALEKAHADLDALRAQVEKLGLGVVVR